MRLEHYSIQKLRRELRSIVAQHLDLDQYQLIFFGSRVAGRGGPRSDIDVGILGPKPIPLGVMRAMREAVEDVPTLYTIDLVDFTRASDQFRRVALEHIEPV